MSNAASPPTPTAPTAPGGPILFAELSLPVEGMTCASCVNRIERFLNKTDGVDLAAVNLATETATVRYDPAAVGRDEIVGAIRAAGYDVRASALLAAQAGDAGAVATVAEEEDEVERRSRSRSPWGSWSSCSGPSCRGRWRS
jgi:Cu+-exporting ATPase